MRRPRAVISVASNKGGVGKTTLATNLAIYLRALHEDLPVLLLGLDDQTIIDRMFCLSPSGGPEANLKHGWAERSLSRVMRVGQFGIHYVPTPPDTGPLKTRAEDPGTLLRILEQTDFEGVVIVDTKSDLEELTRNALFAADLVIVPVADRASFDEAEKVFALLEASGRGGARRGRVLLTLVDRRTRVDRYGHDLHRQLAQAVDARGWPRFHAQISRSPRVEALNSSAGAPGSVLHQARSTAVHRELRELAEEVTKLLDLSVGTAQRPPRALAPPPAPSAAGSLKGALLRGLRGRLS